MKRITEEEILSQQTENGGWTRKKLAQWGVSWPPPKGWKERLICEGVSVGIREPNEEELAWAKAEAEKLGLK